MNNQESTASAYDLYCPYCYSVVEEDVTICGTCEMDTRNDAIVEMTSEEVKNTPNIYCKSCEKSILEYAIKCKFCTKEQS